MPWFGLRACNVTSISFVVALSRTSVWLVFVLVQIADCRLAALARFVVFRSVGLQSGLRGPGPKLSGYRAVVLG